MSSRVPTEARPARRPWRRYLVAGVAFAILIVLVGYRLGGGDPRYPVLVGAGNISSCDWDTDEETARLLDGIAGTVFTLGDNAYRMGSREEFSECYAPTWGRHLARTRPAPGNRDYLTPDAAGYSAYFFNGSEPVASYYAYDIGAWRIYSLNSEVEVSAGSPQEQWLRADLIAQPRRCVLAYWHQSRFSSADYTIGRRLEPLWLALYEAGADVVLGAHNHYYERFAQQTATGEADDQRGIRQFVVGTGGASFHEFGVPKPNSEVRNNRTHGVLKLTLRPESYDWDFIPVAGSSFTDSGTTNCNP